MTKHRKGQKRKQNYQSSLIQTKRNPTNKKTHTLALAHANMLRVKADIHNFLSKQTHKKYA
jgi:hypothetical protein